MKKLAGFLILLVLLLLEGCGSVRTASLAMPTSETTITLKEEFTYTRENSGLMNKNLWTITLAPGSYKSVFEDASGTYYQGNGYVLRQRRDRFESGADVAQKIYVTNYQGGLYIPNDSSQRPKIFHVLGKLTTATLDQAGLPQPVGSATVVIYVSTPISLGQSIASGPLIGAALAAALAVERGNLAFFFDWLQPDPVAVRTAINR